MQPTIEKEISYKGKVYQYSVVEKTKDNRRMLLFIDPILAEGFSFWIPFIRIKKLAEQYRMIHVTGYYGYDADGNISSIKDIADVYYNIFHRENCESISFISFSFGSHPGSLLCKKYSSVIEKAVYISPTFRCSDSALKAYQKYHKSVDKDTTDYFERLVGMIFPIMNGRDAIDNKEDVELLSIILNAKPWNPIAAVLESVNTIVNETEKVLELETRTVDTIAIYGENDYMAPYEVQDWLRKCSVNLKEYVFPGGHNAIHESILEIKRVLENEL